MADKLIVSRALCRNNLSGFGEVCAGVCGDCTVPGQPHPCERAETVWGDDAKVVLDALAEADGATACTPEDHADLKQIAWGEGYAVGCLAEKKLREALEEIRAAHDGFWKSDMTWQSFRKFVGEKVRTALSTSNETGER